VRTHGRWRTYAGKAHDLQTRFRTCGDGTAQIRNADDHEIDRVGFSQRGKRCRDAQRVGHVEKRCRANLVVLQDGPADDSMALQLVETEKFGRCIFLDQDLLGTLQQRETFEEHLGSRIALVFRAKQRRLQRGVALHVRVISALAAEQQHMIAIAKLQLGEFFLQARERTRRCGRSPCELSYCRRYGIPWTHRKTTKSFAAQSFPSRKIPAPCCSTMARA